MSVIGGSKRLLRCSPEVDVLIANGVQVSFALSELFALGAIVLGGYAAIWAVPRVLRLYR